MSLIIIAHNITKDYDAPRHGNEEPKAVLFRADGTADYDVEVSINRKTFLWSGQIENHPRVLDGGASLLRRIANAIDKHYHTGEYLRYLDAATAEVNHMPPIGPEGVPYAPTKTRQKRKKKGN